MPHYFLHQRNEFNVPDDGEEFADLRGAIVAVVPFEEIVAVRTGGRRPS